MVNSLAAHKYIPRLDKSFTAIGHVGIMTPDEESIPTFLHILKKLRDYNLAYLHIVRAGKKI